MDEMVQRLLAEALLQLGGTMQAHVEDLSDHRGRVQMTRDGDLITASYAAPKGES